MKITHISLAVALALVANCALAQKAGTISLEAGITKHVAPFRTRHVPPPMHAKKIAALYRDTLLNDVIPFWLRHGSQRAKGHTSRSAQQRRFALRVWFGRGRDAPAP